MDNFDDQNQNSSNGSNDSNDSNDTRYNLFIKNQIKMLKVTHPNRHPIYYLTMAANAWWIFSKGDASFLTK